MTGSVERFRRVYADHARPVLAYALRRTDQPDDAADVVAETFLVALRRFDELPDEPQTRAWLYGVARRVLANQRRGSSRRARLGERLRGELGAATVPDHADAVAADADAHRLLEALPERDREVLQLTAWEGLEPREIAEVLGVTANAVRVRLTRARASLRHAAPPAGHLPSTTRTARTARTTEETR